MGKAGKYFAVVVKRREKNSSRWRDTVVDLAEFISRFSTVRTGDHIIARVAVEEPPELGGLLVPDGVSATLIALPTMNTSHPAQQQ